MHGDTLYSPQNGTLSSYGYILCVIHFFQSRSQPLLPNLQILPANWSGHEVLPNSPPLGVHEWQVHPVDGSLCDTYFYKSKGAAEHTLLREFAMKNEQTTAELLVEFFRYFAWEFDYRKSIGESRYIQYDVILYCTHICLHVVTVDSFDS